MTERLVVITDSNLPTDVIEERVLRAASFRVVRARCVSEDDVIAAAGNADAIIVQWAPVTARVIARLTRCRLISRLGIGWDMIDAQAAAARGIAVANTPDYCVEEVAAHTMALALGASRGVLRLDRALRDSHWSIAGNTPPVSRPSSTRFCVIGFGRIGSRVADIARTIGFDVVVHDPFIEAEQIAQRGHRPAQFRAAIEGAGIVSLHVPLTEQTHHLIDASTLAHMQADSFLVNVSRGGLIDEVALAAALHAGEIAGAALDVFEREPLAGSSPLRSAPNLILTPHAAWYSAEALEELPLRASEQVVDFFAGATLTSIVNPEYTRALSMIDRAATDLEPA